jgi:hypothetical protein
MGCHRTVNRCECLWNNYRELYVIVSGLSMKIDAIELEMKAKELKADLDEGSRFMECISGLEDKLTLKINNIESNTIDVKLLHRMKQTIETRQSGCMILVDHLREKVSALSKTLNNIESIGYPPYKCPVCDGTCMRPNPLKGSANTMIPVNLDCIVCEGKGIVWG